VLEHESDNISKTRKDRGKVTMEGLYGTHQRSFDGTISNPHDLFFSKIGGLQPPSKNPKLQSILSQEWVKLRTSNLAGTFTGSIRTKAH